MRVITFNGHAVKRQKKIGDDKIVVYFFNGKPSQIVTPAEWDAGKQNLYYDSTVKRREVVRSL